MLCKHDHQYDSIGTKKKDIVKNQLKTIVNKLKMLMRIKSCLQSRQICSFTLSYLDLTEQKCSLKEISTYTDDIENNKTKKSLVFENNSNNKTHRDLNMLTKR